MSAQGEHEQGSEAWMRQRAGNVTASRIADVMAKTKSGYGASRKNYMTQLVIERLTGEVADSYTNAAMDWGIETEPEARAEYEAREGVLVIETGFIQAPQMMAGASPDGLVGDDGLIEIKCPNSATHLETILTETVPAKYIKQMHWQMFCTDRQWCDFLSYDPRLPEGLDYWLRRVERDEDLMTEILNEVQTFLKELDEMVCKLREMKSA